MQRIGRFALIVFEITLLSALILATRCANYQDVFVAGNVYFVDADCYARMTRAQMVREKPGLIIRHHAFENFPQGTPPHTTAPLDYLIVALSLFLNPFTAHALDLAGAFVSPLLALLGGWFLWWWSVKFRYRWVMLILYAISPILVHGTELGRPDHQSLLILLVAIAICAEWSSQTLQSAQHRERVAAHERCRLGGGDLGFGLRAACALSDSDRHGLYVESPRGFRAGSSRRMDFVRSDNCHRIRNRAACSFVSDLSIHRSFEKLGQHHRRTRARFTDESSLAELVRISAVRSTGLDLDACHNAEKRRAPPRRPRGSRPTHLRPSRRHVFPHCLAGALGIFFCFDFCARASGVAGADQIKRGGLDCVRVVDVSDFTGLGRTALAKRSAIG